jgi:hypothetical protein
MLDLGVKLLTDLLRNGSAINLGGRHCDRSAGENSLLEDKFGGDIRGRS